MNVYLFFKRFCDIFLSILLLVMLSPVFIILSLIIKFQDGGPAVYKQKRIGVRGKEFLFYKFRSMPVDTPTIESSKTQFLKVTPFGKFIRRTNLDELPQFYNVLKGDMSFIGPRPPIPSQIDLMEMRRKNGALGVRPGLTGWAQVNAFDGMSSEKKSEFDGQYVQRVSLLLDMFILYKTIVYFTKRPPTY